MSHERPKSEPNDPLLNDPLEQMRRTLEEADAGVLAASQLAAEMENLIGSVVPEGAKKEPESAFPLLIEYKASRQRQVVKTPQEIISGAEFTVLQTNYHRTTEF